MALLHISTRRVVKMRGDDASCLALQSRCTNQCVLIVRPSRVQPPPVWTS
eukprot:m.2797 g.2797  ORF g.2797 m.2797 type:complete len:50 (-) comp2169_c0_seq1:39-188(-)